jgi:hypothetical protein
MAQCVVHALKAWRSRARVTPASSPASQARTASSAQRSRRLRSTHTAAPVLLAHADVTKNIKYFSMGPKLRHLTVQCHSSRFLKNNSLCSKPNFENAPPFQPGVTNPTMLNTNEITVKIRPANACKAGAGLQSMTLCPLFKTASSPRTDQHHTFRTFIP